jgi:adenylate cyclase
VQGATQFTRAEREAPRRRASRIERGTRLFTGLVLFSYAASHLLGHATGLFLLDTMDRVGRGVLLAPWRTLPGRSLLVASLFVHGGLGLVAFVRRRHLVMPPIEAVQLALGLTIPLLLIPHITNVRLGYTLFGLDDSYFRILYQYWITSPLLGLSRQFALMTALWVHGCLGLHMLMHFRPWYRRWSGLLLAVAAAVPVLAMLGIMNAGWNTSFRVLLEPGFKALHGPPPPGTPDAARRLELQSIWQALQGAYLALLLFAVACRAVRFWHGRRHGGYVVTMPGQTIRVPRGYSLLEASRFGKVKHASMCGGRARCSTCRVKVVEGLEALPPPDDLERATLERIGAPADVRLACRTRPRSNLSVVPLVPVGAPPPGLGIAFQEGYEHTVTALAIDLRDSTRLAEVNLPFDTLFLINSYIGAVNDAIQRNNGYVTSVAGDGVMSVFGVTGPPAAGARNALRAAYDIWTALTALDAELDQGLRAPIRFGIGIHSGVAIVGAVAQSGRSSLQFLGDTGNVASRLEALTKERKCVLIVSTEVFDLAALQSDERLRFDRVALRGRDAELPIYLFADRSAFGALLAAMNRA